ncbi:hypothetical protein EV686_10529 [Paracandidimonas soli]|uniref:Uncharacterized protein n=1 Tax=Paracandidimonas soli TaxID=1917182 RepID=A0A4R3V457_9BURK|nr:hypothetical protein EV686_10529 [Paracandidimonas soli]
MSFFWQNSEFTEAVPYGAACMSFSAAPSVPEIVS